MTTRIIVLALLALTLTAQEPKPDNDLSAENALLHAKIAYLEAQLSELRLTFQYAQQVCSLPDMMRAKLATGDAAAKVSAPKPAAK